ncbi:MAG TPA: MBL fold metallo-hydrolase [Candidatus Limnocylindria bacterium]|nr:MBL fold metallo-hydrolase [Candidatus Limnocylindria bacterium]
MKKLTALLLLLALALPAVALAAQPEAAPAPTLTLIGHASVRITTSAGTVVYIDPYFEGDYTEGADLLLVTHEHRDHNQVDLVTLNEGALFLRVAQTINPDGSYNTYEHMGVTVETLPAENRNHPRSASTGFLLGFDGILVYHAGDTSKIPDMEALAARGVDYALFPIDGQYNMDPREATESAALVGARHSIPMHFLNADPAEFMPENVLRVAYGETIELVGE